MGGSSANNSATSTGADVNKAKTKKKRQKQKQAQQVLERSFGTSAERERE